ncbi:MAG: response regulator, partial [Acetatifactor sp.]|nr:response regulator [Acetatifactor sp.]
INAVLGMNEMILREADDEKILEYSSNIQNAGKTLLSLINSILDFSKIEEGKMEIVPVSYDTASVINNLIVSVMERAKSKGLDFIVEVDEKLPTRMIGDDVRLAQVILNILTNAVKYTEKGYVRFTIREEQREESNIDLYVAVEDTGIGIRKEDLPRLFESFERLDEEKNHGIEGTGLGMSIVISLLKMMGSEIRVESEYGVGSTFYFVIRQQIEDGMPIGDYEKRLIQSRKQDENHLRQIGRASILVVDDNEMNLKVAQNLLGLFGITPHLSKSGFDALECLKKEHYNMILLDHMMPQMDGKETLAKMKSEKLLPDDTKVIALTANAVNGAKEEYLSAGFDDYLSKPIDVKELEKILERWLPKDVLESGIQNTVPDEKPLEDMPTEKKDDGVSSVKQEPKNLLDGLSQLGIDVDTALIYCAGELDFYKEILTDYTQESQKKKQELDTYFESGDWREFKVKIHALKSTSKTIGANALAEKAFELEKAAASEDADYIRENYSVFVSEYLEMVEKIEQVLEL